MGLRLHVSALPPRPWPPTPTGRGCRDGAAIKNFDVLTVKSLENSELVLVDAA